MTKTNSTPPGNHPTEDDALDTRLKRHFEKIQTPEGLSQRIQAGIDQLPSSPQHGLPNWIIDTRWKPAMACLLPLVIGFIAGQVSVIDGESEAMDIASIVYHERFESEWETVGDSPDEF